MERIAFAMSVKPGYEEEYIHRHSQVPPALLELFKTVGIKNYSIFMDGNQLFAYREEETGGQVRERMRIEPVFAEWQEYMRPIMLEVGQEHSTSRPMRKVFYFSGK